MKTTHFKGFIMKNLSIFVAVLFAMACSIAQAQTQEKLSFKCTFGPGSSANWDTGKVLIERANFGIPNATIHFDAIDVAAGSGRMIGNAGSNDLIVLNTGAGITLIETTGAGNFSFVTIFSSHRKETRERNAVMSRHVDTPKGPFPSQYYGTCLPW